MLQAPAARKKVVTTSRPFLVRSSPIPQNRQVQDLPVPSQRETPHLHLQRRAEATARPDAQGPSHPSPAPPISRPMAIALPQNADSGGIPSRSRWTMSPAVPRRRAGWNTSIENFTGINARSQILWMKRNVAGDQFIAVCKRNELRTHYAPVARQDASSRTIFLRASFSNWYRARTAA